MIVAHVAGDMIAFEVSSGRAYATSTILGYWQLFSPVKLIILELARVAVPLFLFFSGYHLARSPRTWKAIISNIKKLVVPMFFWSCFAWAISWRNGEAGWSLSQFIMKFFSGETLTGYFFIILIIQFFVVSRWLVPAVKTRPVYTITICVFIQISVHIYDYVVLFGKLGLIEHVDLITDLGLFPEFLFPRFIVSFVLGVWASLYVNQFKVIIEKYFLLFFFLSAAGALLLIIESGVLVGYSYNMLKVTSQQSVFNAWGAWKISTAIWTIGALFFMVSLSRRWLPFKKKLNMYGRNSYQILLLHGMITSSLTLLSYKYLSKYEWHGLVGFTVCFLIILWGCMAIIRIVQKKGSNWLKTLMLGT